MRLRTTNDVVLYGRPIQVQACLPKLGAYASTRARV